MKKLLLLIFTVWTIQLSAQLIPNNSFESWTIATAGHEDPDNWATANPTTNVFPLYVVTTEKTTDAYDGSFAVKMTSTNVLTLVSPGLITLGDFSVNLFTQVSTLTGGINFNLHPDKVNFHYKFSPASGDSFRMGLWMLRDDGSEVPDTVATALFDGFDTQTEYTFQSIDIEYRSELEPEILNIIFVSTAPGNPVAGSILFIDKVELEYTTGIITDNIDELQVFPNPTKDYLVVNEVFNACGYKVFDLNGRLIKSNNNSKENRIELIGIESGTYILSIEKDGIIHSQKFIKN